MQKAAPCRCFPIGARSEPDRKTGPSAILAFKTHLFPVRRGGRRKFRTEGRTELFSVQIRERARKGKGEDFCNEHLPLDAVFAVGSLVAVLFVPQKGVTGERHVRADLMRLSAVQAHVYAAQIPSRFAHFILRDDLFRPLPRCGIDFDARLFRIFDQICRQNRFPFGKGVEADRLVNFLCAAEAKGGQQFLFSAAVERKRDEPCGVSVKAVHRPRAELFRERSVEPLRIDARKFVRYEDIPVAVYDAVKGTGFLFQRSVIGDLVARTEGHILTRLFSVDADIAVAEKAAEGERTLRIDAVGEIFERRCFAYGELFQLFYPFFRPA